MMGDPLPPNLNYSRVASHRTSASALTEHEVGDIDVASINKSEETAQPLLYNNSHPWGVFFTVLGTVLLDFDADSCQSPARAYLLDVTIPEDHARGLSTFTIMAGLGGFFGYALGGINWDVTFIGALLGGHVRAVFTLITVIFVVCVSYTITSFKEMPLRILELKGDDFQHFENYDNDEENELVIREIRDGGKSYGAMSNTDGEDNDNSTQDNTEEGCVEENHRPRTPRKSNSPDPNASLIVYLMSIIYMPHSIRMLCLTNLFCWMAHVCYSLYFTDFVGEAVFQGNPTAIDGSASRDLYESGVRFGCWGMSMYSLSCACYSTKIERLIKVLGAKKVYVGGLLVYSTGMFLMAITKHKIGVILFSWTAGVMYSTLFTMPYLIVAHYHAKGTLDHSTCADYEQRENMKQKSTTVRNNCGREREDIYTNPRFGHRYCPSFQHGVLSTVHSFYVHGHHRQCYRNYHRGSKRS